LRRAAPRVGKQPINHVAAAFTQNKRYRTKPPPLDGVVNRNGDSVYQTDAVFIAY
jgi:hypothetical protein